MAEYQRLFAHGLIETLQTSREQFVCNKSRSGICGDELATHNCNQVCSVLCCDEGDAWLQVAPRIKDAMQQAGDAMIGFQPLQGLPNFFRIVFPSAWTVTTADLDALMTRIEAFGNKLFPALQQ